MPSARTATKRPRKKAPAKKRRLLVDEVWTARLLVEAATSGFLEELSNRKAREIAKAYRFDAGTIDGAAAKRIRKLMQQAVAQAERDGIAREGPLFANVATIGKYLHLSRVAQDLLAFAVQLEVDETLSEVVAVFGAVTPATLKRLLAKALDLSPAKVSEALSPNSALIRTRFIILGGGRSASYMSSSNLLEVPTWASEVLLREHVDGDALVAKFFRISKETALGAKDFDHIGGQIELLERLLRATLEQRVRGVNVLVYGSPGTGKTELARVVAARVSARLFEVSCEDTDGDAHDRSGRLSSYLLCQRALCDARDAVVLFDEAEDVFPRQSFPLFGTRRATGDGKGWTVRMLEENITPAIWISNNVDHIDPAFVRRYDMVVELGLPPPPVRRRIAESHTCELGVSEAWLKRVAQDERVRPGHIERAARVVKRIGPQGAPEAERMLSELLESTLAAQGLHVSKLPVRNDACDYDLSLVNADCDLAELARGLAAQRRGAMCLYGPSGTGKSAFVGHLADRLGMPLHVHRASDLLDCYLGGTEANLAGAFRAAQQQRALLFLDEADSFLRTRRDAVRSWEVSQVNELLVQIEAFEGLVVCATNFLEILDDAVFRRFALKIRFAPLRAEQRGQMLAATLKRLGTRSPRGKQAQALRASLQQLTELTPGDFAAVARRAQLLGGTMSAQAFVTALGEECRVKERRQVNAIGFRA